MTNVDIISKANKLIKSGNPALVKIGENLLKQNKTEPLKPLESPILVDNIVDDVTQSDNNRVCRREPIRVGKNLFVDNGLEGNDSENERLKKLTNISPRTRRYVPANVVCSVCGRKEQVHPMHVRRNDGENTYRCTKCSIVRT